MTRNGSRLAEAVANTYSRLTLGCLVSIVREFWTCQRAFVPTSVTSALVKEETRNFFSSFVTRRGSREAVLVGAGDEMELDSKLAHQIIYRLDAEVEGSK